MAEDKTSDELTERDIEDLNDPDDNPDVADADATEHNLRRAVIICFIVTSVMCLCINIVVLLMLQRKGKLDKAAANLDEFKENMQHLASDTAVSVGACPYGQAPSHMYSHWPDGLDMPCAQ